ncbi:peptidylprolyl isomerase [Myxococcota bacterium]|nr:peptidylprolyl isomerase [Myxococcota bacterium]
MSRVSASLLVASCPGAGSRLARVAAFALAIAGGCTPDPSPGSAPFCGRDRPAVGTIDGQPVPCDAFVRALVEDQGEAFFQRYVERVLAARAAEKAGITLEPQAVDRAVAFELEGTLRDQFSGDRRAMEAQLARYGVTLEGWRRARAAEKTADLLVERLMTANPGSEAVDALFEQRFGVGGVRHQIRHIFFSTQVGQSRAYPRSEYEAERASIIAAARARATAIRARALAGEDMAVLARTESDDASAEKGGLGADGHRNRFGAEIDAALARLEKGQTSPVLESPRGFHVFRHEGVRRGAHYQGAHIFVSARPTSPGDDRPEAVRFQAALERITEARRRVLDGAAFGEVARASTDDAVTRERDGELGAFDTGRLGSEVDAVLETLALDTPSEPIRTPTGWEVVVLRAREFDPALDRPIIRHVLVSTEYAAVKARRLSATLPARARAAAEAVLAEISAGADFGALARVRSEDESTRRSGGELPNYRPGQLGPEIDAALAGLKPGERTIVPTTKGVHVIELVAHLVTDKARVEAELRRELAQRTVTGGDVKRHLSELRTRAKVERAF